VPKLLLVSQAIALDVGFDALSNFSAAKRTFGHLLSASPACTSVPARNEYLRISPLMVKEAFHVTSEQGSAAADEQQHLQCYHGNIMLPAHLAQEPV
jgi:hypothetical protein